MNLHHASWIECHSIEFELKFFYLVHWIKIKVSIEILNELNLFEFVWIWLNLVELNHIEFNWLQIGWI
jgi:hypothetical protein